MTMSISILKVVVDNKLVHVAHSEDDDERVWVEFEGLEIDEELTLTISELLEDSYGGDETSGWVSVRDLTNFEDSSGRVKIDWQSVQFDQDHNVKVS